MIYIIGIGMGNTETLTERAKKAIDGSSLIIGAERMIEPYKAAKNTFNEYRADEIAKKINESKDSNISVLFSGDVGFYSGAKKLIEILDTEYELIAGISSLAYFCSKIGKSYDDAFITSIHGRKGNIIQHIKRNKKVFFLLSGSNDIETLCKKLKRYNMDITLNIGTRLSYDDEKIFTLKSSEIKSFDFDMPSVILAENENPVDLSLSEIPDSDFIRGDVPMTKSEVRTVSIAKMGLKKNSVVYDIGAGTGSVSVEAALKAVDGTVYAIEKNKTAIELIEKNKTKFAADNIEIIEGKAPEVIKDLPEPTHIFIGGSSGNIGDIIKASKAKNNNVKIVVNAVSLNTVNELMRIIEENGFDTQIVQINTSRAEKLGRYFMMKAQNPIYIFSIK